MAIAFLRNPIHNMIVKISRGVVSPELLCADLGNISFA